MRLRLRTRRAGENFHLKLPNNITQKLQSNKQGSSTTDVACVLCQWWIFAIQFGASLLMHIQGLSALMEYQKSVNVATKALTGAGLEGVLIFSLLYFLLLSTNRLLGIGLALVIAIASTTCLLADYTFQTKTQGELPDMWTILLGLKEVWPNLKGEFSSNAGHLAWSFFWAFSAAALAGLLVCVAMSRANLNLGHLSTTQQQQQNRHGLRAYFLALFIGMLGLYTLGAWMPIFHTVASICGSLVYSPPGWSPQLKTSLDANKNTVASSDVPNVVLIMHDSLSGEGGMTDSNNKVPFFQKMMHSQDEFFVFENARTISGDTQDCLTAIQSGCIPLNKKEGLELALNTTLGAEFKRKGYETVSFSSGTINAIKQTKWFMIYNQLTLGFDHVFSPETTNDVLVNGPSTNDIFMAKHFGQWLAGEGGLGEWSGFDLNQKKESKKPFYAQFYYLNAHYPFYNDVNISKTSNRINGMYTTIDRSIESVFVSLEQAGVLDNTVVIGVGDHGESHGGKLYGRLSKWNAMILHPLMYMHVPKKIANKYPSISATLRHNTKQLVSTLDLHKTLLHILEGNTPKDYPSTNEHCIRGLDLFDTKIQDDRVAWSITGVSSGTDGNRGSMALHSGISSLYNRWGWPRFNFLAVVEYGTKIEGLGLEEKKIPISATDDWNRIIKNMAGTSDEAILRTKSKHTEVFLNTLAEHQDPVIKSLQ